MKQTAYFSEKPDVVTVCVLPTGASDVWLRRNIVEKQIADTTDGEAMTQWECEEVYARHGEVAEFRLQACFVHDEARVHLSEEFAAQGEAVSVVVLAARVVADEIGRAHV